MRTKEPIEFRRGFDHPQLDGRGRPPHDDEKLSKIVPEDGASWEAFERTAMSPLLASRQGRIQPQQIVCYESILAAAVKLYSAWALRQFGKGEPQPLRTERITKALVLRSFVYLRGPCGGPVRQSDPLLLRAILLGVVFALFTPFVSP